MHYVFNYDKESDTYSLSEDFKELFALFKNSLEKFKNLKWENLLQSEHKISCFADYGFIDPFLKFVKKMMNFILYKNSSSPNNQIIIEFLYLITEQKL